MQETKGHVNLKHTRIRSTNVKWSEASLADRKQRVTSAVNHLP